MTQAETANRKAAFSFSVLNPMEDTQFKSFNYGKSRSNLHLQNTINNFLKTPEEMDADFCLEITALKLHLKDQYNKPAGTNRQFLDTHNRYTPDNTHTGFMEENY